MTKAEREQIAKVIAKYPDNETTLEMLREFPDLKGVFESWVAFYKSSNDLMKDNNKKRNEY